MSGSIESIIANPAPVDVLGQYQKWAQLGQTQAQTGQIGAQTGLLGAQTQQAQTAADLAKLQLAKTGYLYGAIGIPGTGPSGGAPGTSGVAGAGAAAGAPEPAGGAGVAAGGAGGAGGAGAGGGGSPGGSYPGQIGMQYFGVPMPALLAVGAIGAPDQGAQVKAALETRRQAIFSGVSTAPPGDYPAAMMNLYRAGWITPQQMQDAVQHPEGRARILQATQTPEAYQSMLNTQLGMGVQPDLLTGSPQLSPVGVAAKGATAASTAAGSGQYETMQLTVPDPANPGQFHTITTTKTNGAQILANGGGARPTTVADMSNPNITASPASYVGSLVAHENGGGAPDAKNPNSNAIGNAQFIPSTWLQVVKSAKPAWADGMSDSQILAARTDPAKAGQMAWAYAQQNAPLLTAEGLPVNKLTLGLSHQLGPADARKVLAAPPNTPMSQLTSPAVIQANNWQRATAGQVAARAYQDYGVNAVDVSQPYVAPGSAGAGAGAGAGAAPSSPPGSIAGPPVLTPTQTAGLDVTKGLIGSDGKVAQEAVTAAQRGQAGNTIIRQTRDLVPQINAGSAAEFRQGIQNWAATWSPEFAQKMMTFLSAGNFDPSKAGATQEAAKFLFQQGTNQMQTSLGTNGGAEAARMYLSANPNISMQPTAIHDMLNVLAVANQRGIDYGQGLNDFYQGQVQGFQQGGGKYQPVAAFQKQFLADNPPQIYVKAAEGLNGHPYADWSKNLSKDQIMNVIRIVARTDPSAKMIGPDGKTYPVAMLAQGSGTP